MSAALLTKLGPPPAGLTELYHDIPMRDGYMSNIKIHKPSEGPAGPLVVLCFGGGFVGGDNDQLSEYARILVKLFGATVVNINYRLAPEHKFPMSQLDAWDSMKWIAENARGPLLGADPTKGFIMGGVSAGASLTGALSRKFQEEPLAYPLTGQWLCVPPLMDDECCPDKYKSYYVFMETNAVNPGLSKQAIDMLKRETGWDTAGDLGCAARSKTPISGQPKTYIQVDGMDPLRDEGLIYDEMLKEAGVKTKIDMYPGCPHGSVFMLSMLEIGQKGNVDAIVGFGWLLGKKISREEAAKALGYTL